MRTSIINTIFRKEILEVLRDKRTLYLVILLPFFLYPALFFLIGKVGQSQAGKMQQEKVTVLIDPALEQTPVPALIGSDPSFVVKVQAFDSQALTEEKNTIGIRVDGNYAAGLAANESVILRITGDFSKDLLDGRKQSITGLLNKLNQSLLEERLQGVKLPPTFAQPLLIQEEDLAKPSQRIGKVLGTYAPMLLMLFIFTGCIYIAIDITAGEKERRTLQTLFTTPVNVREIIAGKFLAVACVGLASALMNLFSLVFAVLLQAKIMGGNVSAISLAVSAQGWVWMITLIVLSTVFLAALSMAVSLLANSYKESQSYVSPLMMLVLIPAVMAQMPGMELTMTTALVPVLNICLAIGAIFKGTFSLPAMVLVVFFALLYGLLALYLASHIFGNENVVTGEKVNWKLLRGEG